MKLIYNTYILNIVEAFRGSMCRLQNIAMLDYQESVTTGQTDAGQSDPYV